MLLLSLALAQSPHAQQLQQFGHTLAWKLPENAKTPLASHKKQSSEQQAIVYGYHPYWGDDPTQLDFERLTDLAIFEVQIDSDGTLSNTSYWTDVAGSVVPLAHAHGVRVHLCVISFDDSVQASVLPSASKRASVIAELKSLVDQYGADGVNVDIEGLDSDLREDMLDFLFELDAAVGDVWAATPAIDWSEAWDEQAMSQLSGGMFIMGYGYHWTGGDPGPNDPLFGGDPWSNYSLAATIDDYLAEGADPRKIVVGLPLYGQEWPVSSQQVPGNASDDGWSVIMYEAEDVAASEGREWDDVTHSPYVLRSGTQLWYDDNASVEERIVWSVAEGLGGVGFWALTYEGDDAAFWDMVERTTVRNVPGDSGGDSGGVDSGGGDGGPVARAGQAIKAVAGDTVYLNGRGSRDPEGMPLAWAWTQTLGPETVELIDVDEPEPHFLARTPGIYNFELVVSSRNGSSRADVVEVVVSEASGFCGVSERVGGLGLVLGAWLVLVRRRHVQ